MSLFNLFTKSLSESTFFGLLLSGGFLDLGAEAMEFVLVDLFKSKTVQPGEIKQLVNSIQAIAPGLKQVKKDFRALLAK